ncbi:MAG: hypothetical protein QS721_05115 [Candidatus Endonucleobacter sp. (ex Gigantidas childressi)]|nr:hypothetical protein [Candidatus Endonucleobacter sp. (ex Gigantidas childressi)]
MGLRNHSLMALFSLLPIATTVGLTLDEWQNQFLKDKLPIPSDLQEQYCSARASLSDDARLLGLTVRLPKTSAVADSQESLSTKNKSSPLLSKQSKSHEKTISKENASEKVPSLESQSRTVASAVNQQVTLDGQWEIINVIGINEDQVGVIYPDKEDVTLVNFALHASEKNTVAILLLRQLDCSEADANPTLRLVESVDGDLCIPANSLVAMDVSSRNVPQYRSIFGSSLNQTLLCRDPHMGLQLCSKSSFIHLSLK